jgi:hypothetical protein
MKLAGYDFEGPFTDLSDVKDLPGVYVVLSFGVLDVGESGWRYHEGGQGISTRLRTHDRKPCWELVTGKFKGRASAWPEALAACDGAFAKGTLEDKCRQHGISLQGDKKELCARLYGAGDIDVVDLMEKHLQALREQLLRDHCIENIAFAVHYEPDGQKRLQIEQALRQHFNPPGDSGSTPELPSASDK